MPGERLDRILDRLSSGGAVDPGPADLCAVSCEVTATTGASIMLLSDGEPQGSVCATDAASATLEELQYTLGEGPCIDAHRLDRPVVEEDLARPGTLRWVAFTPPALDAGARAVFGFPLQVGAVRLGALNLYRDRPGALTDDQHANALVVAGVTGQALLVMQAEDPDEGLATRLEASVNLRNVVHQAAGMVAVQLGVGLPEAMVRLRGHSFGQDLTLSEVSEAVVARTVRFHPDGAAS